MANRGYIESLLSPLPLDLRKPFTDLFRYLLKDLRFGQVVSGDPAENFGGGFFTTTTPAVANTEFTIAHSFGRTPYVVIPVLPLNVVNATLVPLTVSRAADANRVYLKSSAQTATVYVYMEG